VFRRVFYADVWCFFTGTLSSPEALRFFDSRDIEEDSVIREKGRDFVSFWLDFFRLFSIAFFTARLPPCAAIASYWALRSSFFLSAVWDNGLVLVAMPKYKAKTHRSSTKRLSCLVAAYSAPPWSRHSELPAVLFPACPC
jgi:hypothetical protein